MLNINSRKKNRQVAWGVEDMGFPGVLKKYQVKFPGLIKNNVVFPAGVIKKMKNHVEFLEILVWCLKISEECNTILWSF